jgi:hypothetical protein
MTTSSAPYLAFASFPLPRFPAPVKLLRFESGLLVRPWRPKTGRPDNKKGSKKKRKKKWSELKRKLARPPLSASMLDWLKQRVIAWLLSRTVGKWIAIDRQKLQAEAGTSEWTLVADDLLVKPGAPKHKSYAFARPRCMYCRDCHE